MRLKLTLPREPSHTGFVIAVGWISTTELLSIGDDRKLLKWDLNTGESSIVATLPENIFPTDLRWLPLVNSGNRKSVTVDNFVLTSSDGQYYYVSKTGRVEKSVDAHKGAVIRCRWSSDGTSLLTVGEEGAVKVWSRNGMLRSTVCHNSQAVYDGCWSPDNGSVLYNQGGNLYIKVLQGPQKQHKQWKAHDAVVLCLDWSAINGSIVSGSEDGKYKVWDRFGRLLYASAEHDHPITSAAWAPDGHLFAVGSFNTLRLCDKAGWSHCLEKPSTGSIFSIAWSADGTQFGAACANGHVVFAHVIENRVEWREYEAVQTKRKTIEVTNVSNNSKETLQTRDRIVKMSLGWNCLIVATTKQCYVFSSKNWNTPNIFDLMDGSMNLILQSSK